MDERPGQPAFAEYVALLNGFLQRRDEIVESLQGILNAQRLPIAYQQDGPRLSRHIEDCFFKPASLSPSQSRLRGQLQASHWASGFQPRESPGLHNDLIDPAQMMIRGFHFWSQTRWPGRNGRVRYAHTLFNVYLLRSLELLSMRLWDCGAGAPGERLSEIQLALDQLWTGMPADQPVLVRDARWLIPLAESPTTNDLSPYFRVAQHIAETLPENDRIEIQKAGVHMAGGHLRSQLRHYGMHKGAALDDPSLLLSSRNSNALDFALTIQSLVPLLDAYEHAVFTADHRARRALADVITQGISPDPDLFVNRIDLLGAYSMIEYLFITTDHSGQVVYTPMGQRHVQLLREYRAKISRVAAPLSQDLAHFKPIAGGYSPYGLIYGFSSNLAEHMALKTLQPGASTHFSMEDAFAEGDAEKLAWVSGWRKLPHISPEVQTLFDYPQQFAADIFERIEQALHSRNRIADGNSTPVVRRGRLFIPPQDERDAASNAAPDAASIPELPADYIRSSDRQQVTTQRAHFSDEALLLRDRDEGMFLVSYQTSHGWAAISKDVLTELLGTGRDVKIVGLPSAAAGVLRLMCPELVYPARAPAPTPSQNSSSHS